MGVKERQSKIDQQITDLELEEQLTNDVKEKVTKMFGKVLESASELAWSIANDYTNKYLEYDTYVNCRNKIRDEISKEAYQSARESKNWWGKEIRQAIFQDHKEEILALIKDDQIENLERQIRIANDYAMKRF